MTSLMLYPPGKEKENADCKEDYRDLIKDPPHAEAARFPGLVLAGDKTPRQKPHSIDDAP